MTHHLTCPHCSSRQTYGDARPRFCSSCGQSLASVAHEEPTVVDDDPDATLAPTVDPEAATLAPLPRGDASSATPETVGGYQLLRVLGGGGMGTVYEAVEQSTGRHVALKLILPEYAAAPETIERFRQEGQLASSLAHPRCVFVLAADQDQGRPYIVMELMQGKTLQDLVADEGPLQPTRAIRKILDVIEGLHQAHQVGMVHRDVKPSNCFLEPDGHVKIGDFGLAKSLMVETQLTRTGTFLGTPLYASPEQVKREQVDAQSDTYSVAATLYFLLTGKAPFQSGDAVATLARIVSDDPPSMLTLKPDLPKALDKVVLKGLQRDRRRRYRDLEELRRALVPFLPAKPSVSGLGLRFGAYLIDSFLLYLASLGTNAVAYFLLNAASPSELTLVQFFLIEGMNFLMIVGYFGILEGRFGRSLGKRLLRLRVSGLDSHEPPGIWTSTVRATVLMATFVPAQLVPGVIVLLFLPGVNLVPGARPATNEQAILMSVVGVLRIVLTAAGIVATIFTMRPRNGYRGLHELASQTRTFALRWPQLRRRRHVRIDDYQPHLQPATGLTEVIGPYRVKGALHAVNDERTLLAEDAQLARSVWLTLRPAGAAPLAEKVRDVKRVTRSRWLGHGVIDAWQWDAFLAPKGSPLTALVTPVKPLTWSEARPLLEDLVNELTSAVKDGSLPETLTVGQLWVLPGGHVQLLPTPLLGMHEGTVILATDESSERHALRFVHEAVAFALTGRALGRDNAPDSIVAPVPVHAEQILKKVSGQDEPYATLQELNHDLDLTHDKATEVTRLRRALHLGITVLLSFIPFLVPVLLPALLMGAVGEARSMAAGNSLDPLLPAFLGGMLTWFVAWPWLTRGGYAYYRGGIALRTAAGQRVSRWKCGVRSLMVWGPFALFVVGVMTLAYFQPSMPGLHAIMMILGGGFLLGHAVGAILSPRQNWHDRLLGIHLVPD